MIVTEDPLISGSESENKENQVLCDLLMLDLVVTGLQVDMKTEDERTVVLNMCVCLCVC